MDVGAAFLAADRDYTPAYLALEQLVAERKTRLAGRALNDEWHRPK
jgi:hypothetical protein